MIAQFRLKYTQHKASVHYLLKLLSAYLLIRLMIFVLGDDQRIPVDSRLFPILSTYYEHFNDGLRSFYLGSTHFILSRIQFPESKIVISNWCLGVRLWLYLVVLIGLYKDDAPKIRKWTFIFAGVLSIMGLSILRFVGLSIVNHFHPNWLHFAHDYVFNGSIYLYCVLLTYLWVNKFSIDKFD